LSFRQLDDPLRCVQRPFDWTRDSELKKQLIVRTALVAVVLVLVVFGFWMYSLPSTKAIDAPAVAQTEIDTTLARLKPPQRERPLIAIIGLNDATETTDYLMPAGILRRAQIADVLLLATGAGPVKLYPALNVEPDATIAQFDAQHADGADYVIVPAMSRDDDPAVLAWLKNQSMKGATIIAVCAGAKVAAAAGLLDGQRATTHWYYLKEMLEKHPSIRYVPDRRFIVNERIATTTGITASMPMMLTLIEAIAGADKARAIASDLGLEHWDARHASDAFKLTRPFALTVMSNRLAFWKREELGVELRSGVDEISLALVADAWSRTYRSRARTFAARAGVIETREGVRILPDQVASEWPSGARIVLADNRPARQLDDALEAIEDRYGMRTAAVVAMQLEYPRLRTR
jgi:putative intracellular protease/amidase